MYEHRYLEKINKLCENYGKCDDQQQCREIIEAEMVSTTEGSTYRIPTPPSQYLAVKNVSARKPLRQSSEELDVKHKTSVYSLGPTK